MKRWLTFGWIAALRFLAEGWMQTTFILGGIAVGVGVIIFMAAMLASVQSNYTNRVLTWQPHIQLQPPDEVVRPLRQGAGQIEAATIQRPTQRNRSLDQWQTMLVDMKARSDVVVATPSVSGFALAIRGDASRSISILGIMTDDYFRIVRLPDYMVAGTPDIGTDDILIGVDLADDLGAETGDKLNVNAANGAMRTLTVKGVFDVGNRGANERNTYVALRTAQSLLDLVGGVTDINITVSDVYAAESTAQEITAVLPVRAQSWIKTNFQFFTAIKAQTISSLLIRSLVGLSVAFGIAAVLVVSVLQRSKDIGILRAMGSSRGQVLRIFLIQGGVLGFLGSILGSALGGVALFLWHRYARQPSGQEFFPLIVRPSLFLWSSLLATLTGFFAGTVPALRAANLDPVEAMRG